MPKKTTKTKDYLDYLTELGVEFFQSGQGLCYAKMKTGEASYALPLESSAFSQFVFLKIFEHNEQALEEPQVRKIVTACRAMALFGDDRREVYTRTAPIDPSNPNSGLEIDLGDDTGQCVRITPQGIELTKPSVEFLRPQNMKPLPVPASQGDIWKIFDYVNVEDRDQQLALLSFMINALVPANEYPLLILTGQEGSGKTTATEFISSLIDPRTGVKRAMPKNERELAISASRSHLMTFDNLSGIRFNISDFLCRLSTGGTFEIRKLYTDSDVIELNFTKPAILNSIVDLVSKPDLAQRTYILELSSLSSKNRMGKNELISSFDEHRAVMFRGVCEAIQMGLQMRRVTKVLKAPRMLDSAHFAASASSAFKATPHEVVQSLHKVQENQKLYIASVDPVYQAILGFTKIGSCWEGTASELYELLSDKFSADDRQKPSNWPKNVEAFSKDLKRLVGNLRSHGIEVESKRTAKRRGLIISRKAVDDTIQEFARVSVA